ncbi:hypothetical protein JNJ66_07390 [Candidatus Saccharibacteria bacterium]|nr:hypothetical protein [Candidatus Saccharibacteria bacterium]
MTQKKIISKNGSKTDGLKRQHLVVGVLAAAAGVILVVVVLLIAKVAGGAWQAEEDKRTLMHTDQIVEASKEKHVIRGTVVEKQTSCGGERLPGYDEYQLTIGICDGGNAVSVDGLIISTGGGALNGGAREHISDIKDIHAGDKVEVRYVKNGEWASTNCESCYVKKH